MKGYGVLHFTDKPQSSISIAEMYSNELTEALRPASESGDK